MKVILVFPRFKYKSGDPPLGIAYVASYLRAHLNVDLSIIDTTFNPSFEHVESVLYKEKPDIVGIYFDTLMFHDGLKIANIAKKLGIFVVAGGPHATVMPQTLIDKVDAVVIGEGEITFKELVENFPKLQSVKGIWHRKGKKIFKNPPREPIENLDELPPPARDLLPIKNYIANWHLLDSIDPKLLGTNIVASRGCPFNCSFCQPTLRIMFGNKVRRRDANEIIKEIKDVKENYGVSAIFFHDDTFTANRDWVIEFCNSLKQENLDIIWGCNSRVNTLDKKLMEIMYSAGCREFHLGVESSSQRILDEIYHKGIKVEDARKITTLAKKIGIHTLCFFMIGAPTETEKEINEMIKFACSLDTDEITVSITTPLPKTQLYDIVKQNYKISENFDDFDYYSSRAFEDKNLSFKRLKYLQRKILIMFYLHPKHLSYLLKHMSSIKGMHKMITKIRRFV